MKKLMIMSAFALMASASFTNTQAQVKPGNGAGQLFLKDDGCYWVVKQHSILFGLIQWETEDKVWCGPGFGLGW